MQIVPVSDHVRLPTFTEAIIPIIFMVISLGVGIFVFDSDPHIPLLLSAGVAAIIAMRLGFHWKEIEEGMLDAVRLALQAIVILMVIGTIIASWIGAGIVPTLIYYGLDILDPSYFLVAACLICCIVSIASGNAWTAAGTIGIAIMGVGYGLGMNPAAVAGAVISGVYFGDKISPLSESTNLAPGIVGADLFEHIKYMLYTTVPGVLIALCLYAFIGTTDWALSPEAIALAEAATEAGGEAGIGQVAKVQAQMKDLFVITPWLLIVPSMIIVIMVFKIPAFPGLMIGSMMGAICAIFVQGAEPGAVFDSLYNGYDLLVANESRVLADPTVLEDELILSLFHEAGGITSVLYTVSLVIIAMCFGGVLEFTKIFETLVQSMLRFARRTSSLIATTVVTCFSSNVVGCDQYMSIIIPARMFVEEYKRRGLHPKVLSRTLEDAGTMTSPLIPWNTCGAFMSGTLGVATFDYLPFAFLCLLSPMIALFYAFTGLTIEYVTPEEVKEEEYYVPTEFIEKRLD